MRAAAPAAWLTSLQTCRELADRTRAEHGVKHELEQGAAGHAAVDHVAGAEPEHDDDAGKGQEQRRDGDNARAFIMVRAAS